MSRPIGHPQTQTRLLVVALASALVLSLVPTGYSGWVGWFGDVARNVIAPISHPVSRFSRWVSPGDPLSGDPELVRRLKRERERYRTLYLRELDVNRELREDIRALQRGRAVQPEARYDLVTAPVIGRSSDVGGGTLTVRLGRASGVDRNTVATIGGYQLVGRVVEVGSRTCQVRPITDRRAGILFGRVMLTEDGRGPICRLEQGPEGLLRGPVEDRPEDLARATGAIERGMTVRLDDPAWPSNAQTLEIGRVERVRTNPDQPLRRVVEVRPASRLDRLGEVELRIVEPGGGTAGMTGGASEEGAG